MNLSKNEVHRYVPAQYGDKPDAPVYFYKTVTKMDLARHAREVSAAGARSPSQAELLLEMRKAVEAIVDIADRPYLSELIDLLQAGKLEIQDDIDAAQALENVVRSNWPPYARLMADREYYLKIASLVAFKMFVTGWENTGVEYSRFNNMVSDSAFEAIDSGDAMEVGFSALMRSRISAGDAKKSPSPSPSGTSPQPSVAPSQPTEEEAGSSPV